MKRLLVLIAVLASTVALSGPNPVSAAANPGTIVASYNNQAHVYELSATAVNAVVGDTIQVNNTTGSTIDVGTDVGANAGILSAGAQACNPLQAQAICNVASGNTTTYTVTQLGVITVRFGNGTKRTFTVGTGVGGATGPATTVKASYDPNGGECIFNGTKTTSKYDSFTIGSSYAPGNDECARPQCVHVGWNVSSSATTPVPANLALLKNDGRWLHVTNEETRRSFVAKSGDFVADWVQAPKFNDITLPTNGSTGLVWDSGCRGLVRFDGSGPCSVNGSSSVTVSGQVTISAGGQAGSCTVRATPVFTAYQNLDGTDLSVTTSASTLPSSTFTVKVEGRPRLEVKRSGPGVVYMMEQPGILCGDWYLFEFPQLGTMCGLDGAATRTLYAVPVKGQSFLGWDGACKNTPINAACTVSVTGPTTAEARFGLVNLTVDKPGSGTVSEFTFSTPRINCGATCSAGLLKDSSILLVAAPAPGQYFVEWAGACAGTPSTSACSLTVANDTKATALFAAGNRLVVDIAPREGNDGVVWSVPYGLICGGPFEACDVTFPPTVSEFTLFASNGRDHRFSGWGGACSGTATTSTCSVSFATGSKERRVTVSYEEREWVPVATFADLIYGMSRDGRTVLTATAFTARVLRENSRTGEWKSILEIPSYLSFSRLSGDGNTVVTCVNSGLSLVVVVRRWNETSSTWQQVGDPIYGTDGCPEVFSDDGSVLATPGNIYDRRAGSGSWVKRSIPKDLIFKAVNRPGTIALFATLSSNRKLSYATYQWNPDTSTWTRLEAIERSVDGPYAISDNGRFVFGNSDSPDQKTFDQIYDTVLKTWILRSVPDGGILGISPRGDSVVVARLRGLNAGGVSAGFAVFRWEPITSRWVQYGREIDFFLTSSSASDGSVGRIALGGTIYEWSFPRR